MPKVIYETDRRIGRVTLNRPEVTAAIDNDLPEELGWKRAVRERDEGTSDWTANRPYEDES